MMKTRGFLFTVGICFAITFTFSCSSDSGGGDPDPGGGKGNDIENYKTVLIGTQTWMAENLNYAVKGSKCYGQDGKVSDEDKNEITLSSDEVQANCEKYGRLYDFATAKTVCPAGWHLPSQAEWEVLVNHAGGSSTAGTKLKADSGWDNNGNGTDDYEFAALPGGYGHPYRSEFYDTGSYGYWWSASEDSEGAYTLTMSSSDNTQGYSDNKSSLYSVRCLKN